jgi:hypothetical protein
MNSQEDFMCLSTDDRPCTDSVPPLAGHPAFFVAACSGEPVRSEKASTAAEAKLSSRYVPENVIKDEVYAFLAAWDESQARKRELAAGAGGVSAPMDIVADIDFEPVRCLGLTGLPPPKLFYRTFWRSITRRLVHQTQESRT